MTKEEFERLWNEKYVPLRYEDVKDEYEKFVKEADKHIFIEDYEANNAISRDDFLDNLTEDAMFTFQDTLTEAFYDKNPQVYETAFELYEESLMNNTKENPAIVFHEEYNRLYRKFMGEMFGCFFE